MSFAFSCYLWYPISVVQFLGSTIIYGYETFVPAYDQSTREFQGASLGDLVSVRDCSDILEGQNLPRVRQIDVLWFDEDDHGLFPIYGFEVEHTTRVREALDRLLKIPARFRADLFLVGPDEEKKALFDRLVNQYSGPQKLDNRNGVP